MNAGGVGWALLGAVSLVTAPAMAQDAGDASTPDAALGADVDAGTSRECTGSGQCARPTPYCHPRLGQCVACLADQNCATSTGICDEAAGKCVECATHTHCFGATPYCDATKDECVACLTDQNCGPQGIRCVDGACGTCGDGICGPGETISSFGDPYGYGGPSAEDPQCLEDCLSTCPATDLGGALGAAVVSGDLVDGDDRLASPACGGQGSPDVTFGWTAPAAGTYVIDTFGSDFNTLLYVIEGSDCTVPPFACNDDTMEAASQVVIDAGAGDVFVIVVDAWDRGGAYVLNVSELSTYDGGGADCNPRDCERAETGEPPCCMFFGECGSQLPFGCDNAGSYGEPPPPPGGGDGGPVDPVIRQRCLTNALGSSSPLCADVAQCTCEFCPQQAEDCRVVPGCRELIECMTDKGCDGLDCNVPALCQPQIASSGGVGGPGFRAATALRTCASRRSCGLSCPEASPEGGSSAPPCTPMREEACPCGDGGMGVRICKDDGSAFSPCVCVAAPAADGGPFVSSGDDGGCGCHVAGPPSRRHVEAFGILVLALGLGGRRRSRRGT